MRPPTTDAQGFVAAQRAALALLTAVYSDVDVPLEDLLGDADPGCAAWMTAMLFASLLRRDYTDASVHTLLASWGAVVAAPLDDGPAGEGRP